MPPRELLSLRGAGADLGCEGISIRGAGAYLGCEGISRRGAGAYLGCEGISMRVCELGAMASIGARRSCGIGLRVYRVEGAGLTVLLRRSWLRSRHCGRGRSGVGSVDGRRGV